MSPGCELSEAVLLVGGLGTRLRPLTYLLPKPLLPVGNLPLVGHQLLWLAREGIKHATLAAGYKADVVWEHLGKRQWGLEPQLVVEPEALDTAGALKLAARPKATFLAANGDLILNIGLGPVVSAHKEAGALATILLRRVDDVSRYGLVIRERMDTVAPVVGFLEKQPFDPSRQGTVNAGVYILEPEVLDYIPAATPWSLERQLFPRLVREKQLVLGYLPEQPYYWIDVGHIEAYLQANYDAASGAWPWCNSGVDATARVASGAQIVPPVIIGAYATIEPGATVGPYTVIGEGSLIGRGAQVVRSVVWGAAVVGEGAKLHEAVVVSGASVNSQAEVIGQVVIAR